MIENIVGFTAIGLIATIVVGLIAWSTVAIANHISYCRSVPTHIKNLR